MTKYVLVLGMVFLAACSTKETVPAADSTATTDTITVMDSVTVTADTTTISK